METLFANVRLITGLTRNLCGAQELAPPVRAEIVHEDSGYSLFRYGAGDAWGGDTWHATLDDAKAQALAELSIAPGDWASNRG